MIPTSRTERPGTAHGNRATWKLRLRRGLRPRVRRAALHVQRGRLLASAASRRRSSSASSAAASARSELEDLVNLAVNGEILDPASGARRTRQRLLARARRPRRALARALAAPPRLPRRLARPARQGGRARRRLRRADRHLRLRAARPHRRRPAPASRSSSRPSPPGAGSPTAATLSDRRWRQLLRVGSGVQRGGAGLRLIASAPSSPTSSSALQRAAGGRGRGSAGVPVERAAPASSAITVVSPPSGARGGRDHRQRAAPRAGCAPRPAPGAPRCGVQPVEACRSARTASPPRDGDPRPRRARRSTPGSCESAEAAKLSARDRRRRGLLPLRDLLRAHADEQSARPRAPPSARAPRAARRSVSVLPGAARRRRSPRASRARAGSATRSPRASGPRSRARAARSARRRAGPRSGCRRRPSSAEAPLIVSMRTSDG